MEDELVIQASTNCVECKNNDIEVVNGVVVCAVCGTPITSTLEIAYLYHV